MMIRDKLNLLQKNADEVNSIIQKRIEKTDLKNQWRNFYETLTAFVNIDNQTVESEKEAIEQEIGNFIRKLNVWKQTSKTYIERLEDSPDMQKAAVGGFGIGIVTMGLIGLGIFLMKRN